MRVRILRQQLPTSAPYWETFDYEGPRDITVIGLLDNLNYHDDIVTAEGKRTTRIAWEDSCLQGVCGACAMVINGIPALACETFLTDLRKEELTLRPLQKFPVVRDLVVDRSSIHENLKQTDVYIGEYQPSADKDFAHQYKAVKCLKCGLCLEVCPSYVDGRTFFGAAFANDCFLVFARNTRKQRTSRRATSATLGRLAQRASPAWTFALWEYPPSPRWPSSTGASGRYTLLGSVYRRREETEACTGRFIASVRRINSHDCSAYRSPRTRRSCARSLPSCPNMPAMTSAWAGLTRTNTPRGS